MLTAELKIYTNNISSKLQEKITIHQNTMEKMGNTHPSKEMRRIKTAWYKSASWPEFSPCQSVEALDNGSGPCWELWIPCYSAQALFFGNWRTNWLLDQEHKWSDLNFRRMNVWLCFFFLLERTEENFLDSGMQKYRDKFPLEVYEGT